MSDLNLNKQQLEAVQHGEGPLLIIAGAGTGKTTVVTERIKFLIASEKVKPEEILALTFTEKASREMEERVDIAMPYGYIQMWISTFHAFCDRILRNEALNIGLDTRFKLYSESESISFLRKNLFNLELNYFRPLGNPTRFVSGLLQHFSRLRDEDIAPEFFLNWVSTQKRSDDYNKWLELAKSYKKYEELKVDSSVMDYSDLISNTIKLFRERRGVLKKYQNQFKYILVDEFQDTNIAQNVLVNLLAEKSKNLTVVADDDQAIYRWRGAAISNVIQFRNVYKEAKVVSLTHNYRSTQLILDAAYRLIQNNNPDRLEIAEKIDKRLKAVKKGNEYSPEFIHAGRVEDEADKITKKIKSLVKDENYAYSDIAVLVRANNHSESITRAFSRLGVPFQFLGPGRLYKQEEVVELIAYLKVLYNFEDSASFYKVLTMEVIKVSPRDISVVSNQAKKFNQSFFEACENYKNLAISSEGKEKIGKLITMINSHLKLIPKESAGQILYRFLEETGYLRRLASAQSPQDEKRAQNTSKLFDRLKTFEAQNENASVYAVVDWIDLAQEVGESPLASDIDWGQENSVSILTIHSSKGLEFPVVFVVNLVSQRFPTIERREQIPIPDELIKEILPLGDYHLQEERRLFYVAITRAKEKLFVTASDYYGEGKREKKLSPFVYEMFDNVESSLTESVQPEQLSILEFAPRESAIDVKSTLKQKYKINFLSFSQIECFRICPLHYRLRYILGIPVSPVAPLSFGNSLHLVMREFNSLLINKLLGRRPEKTIVDLLHGNWISQGFSSKSHEAEMKKRGEEYLLNYLKTDLFNLNNPPKLLEQRFMIPLEYDLKLGGVIDRVDETQRGIEVIDYKTSDFTHKSEPSEADMRKDLQLSIYAMAANMVKEAPFGQDLREITLSLYYFDLGKKISTTRTAGELEKAKSDIIKLKHEIETSDFNCSKNYFCKDCEYKTFCNLVD